MDILLWTFFEPQIVIQCPYFVGYVINIWSTVITEPNLDYTNF